MNTFSLKTSTLVAYIVMVVVNYLAVALPLAGRSTGAISDSYPNLFAPAGYTFSIWGVIYILLGIYAAYQFSRKKDETVTRVNKIFIVNGLLNAAWIFAWHYDFIWLSVLIMVGLLYTLILIADLTGKDALGKKIPWIVREPFSVYFGWITVATIANITVFLVSLRWNGFGLPESYWTVAVLLIGALIGSLRTLKDRAISYGLVLIWAYGGILSKHVTSKGFAWLYPNVVVTAIACMTIFLGMTLFIRFNKKTD